MRVCIHLGRPGSDFDDGGGGGGGGDDDVTIVVVADDVTGTSPLPNALAFDPDSPWRASAPAHCALTPDEQQQQQ